MLNILIAAVLGLTACQDGQFITPPVQPFGNSLNTPQTEQFPQFSYDGRYLVFASDRQGSRQIYLYDRTQGKVLSLPGLNRPGIWQDQPDVSADGRYIVYISEQSGKPDIWLYDRESLEAQNLTENLLGECRHPSISGNGRLIAFENNRSGQWDVMLYDRGVGINLSLPQLPSSSSK
jgi:Tol biopolymer transport system component